MPAAAKAKPSAGKGYTPRPRTARPGLRQPAVESELSPIEFAKLQRKNERQRNQDGPDLNDPADMDRYQHEAEHDLAEDDFHDQRQSHPAPVTFGGAPSGGDASGFLLGLFGTVLFVQYLRGGVPQVRAWMAAKFLNNVAVDANGRVTTNSQGQTTHTPFGNFPAPEPGTSSSPYGPVK